MNTFRKLAVPLTAAFFAIFVQAALGDDWPQWRGPRQDGISRETGLLAQWPEKGPAELWRVPLGNGFSAVSVVGDRAFTLFGSAEGEFAAAFNVANGKTLWKTRLGDLLKNDSYGDGPRATPAVDSGRVYVLSGKGALQCLDAADGKPSGAAISWRSSAASRRVRLFRLAGGDGRHARGGRRRRQRQVARGLR